jgi:hypothetical protein
MAKENANLTGWRGQNWQIRLTTASTRHIRLWFHHDDEPASAHAHLCTRARPWYEMFMYRSLMIVGQMTKTRLGLEEDDSR